MDTPTLILMHDEIINSRPHILLTIKSLAGAVLHRHCMPFTEYSVADDRFINLVMPPRNTYTLPVYPQDFTSMSQVEIRVVRASKCPNYVSTHGKY
jgi:hypothetical protein